MENLDHVWAIVLAAGEGSRLRLLTTDKHGVSIPKQFCTFRSDKSLLRMTIERAKNLVPYDRIITVVSSQHKKWWKPELIDQELRQELRQEPQNVLVQPKNRGTGAGILYCLMNIFLRDRHAKVIILPSDHLVEEEEVLGEAIRKVIPASESNRHRLILMGITPTEPDTEYGWIIPSPQGDDGIRRVSSFVEKPDRNKAIEIMNEGGLWNSFIFITSVTTLIRLYMVTLPDLLRPFLLTLGDHLDGWREGVIAGLYENIPTSDFSRDLLQQTVRHLRVAAVPPCGWTDLGTPARVVRCLEQKRVSYPQVNYPEFDIGYQDHLKMFKR